MPRLHYHFHLKNLMPVHPEPVFDPVFPYQLPICVAVETIDKIDLFKL